MKKFSQLLLAGILGGAIVIASNQVFDNNQSVTQVQTEATVPVSRVVYSMDENGEAVPLDFTAAAEKVTKAVVHIRKVSVSRTTTDTNQIPEEMRRWFGPFMQPEQNQPRVGSGSGVIISQDGYIVTNNHVIEDAAEIEVTLNDNRSFQAELVGTDPTTDIAVIKIEENDLDYLTFVPSADVRVGEWVMAVGNPFNLTSTVTAGIVSAKARAIGILRSGSESGPNESIESFIQTDAAVNPGNSGGALVNLSGQLIGINTAIASNTGSFAGYSFAVPSDIASKVVNDILEYGTVQRGWLGVVIASVTDDLARENDLKVVRGAYISELAETSGAKDAGIKEGDVIMEVDGREIKTNSDVIGYIGQKRPGDIVNIVVDRNGSAKSFKVTLKNRQGSTERVVASNDLMTRLGVEFEEVDEKTLRRLELDFGIRVKELTRSGELAKETSMREGFIITHIGGKPVKTIEDARGAFENAKGGILIEGRYEEYSKKEYYALGIN